MSVSLKTGRVALAITLITGFSMGMMDGASAAMSTDEIANYKGADRQKVLEEGAKKEGELLWIGGLNEKRGTRPILKSFMEKYPFIDAKSIRTGTVQGLQRVLAEYRAKTPRVDVINANVVEDLKQVGLAQKFYSPNMEDYPKEDRSEYYGTLRYSYHGVAAWNTERTKEPPKTYQDLLNPKWKGKLISTDSPDTGVPFMITYLHEAWGEKKAGDYIARLGKQDMQISSASLRNVVDLVIAGEHTILVNPALHHIGQARGKGAPIQAAAADPVLAREGLFVMMSNSPHPHAAMLLMDFLLTEEVAKIISKARYFPAHPDVDPIKAMQPYTPKAMGMKRLAITDAKKIEHEKWATEMFEKHFR